MKEYPEIVSYEVVNKQGTILFSTTNKKYAIEFVDANSGDGLMVIRVTNQIIYEK